jgi:uncharacterized protein
MLPFIATLLLCALPLCAAASPAPLSDPTGAWTGTLVGPGTPIPLVVRIRADARGEWEARLDIPRRGLIDSSVGVVFAGDSVHLALPHAASFRGVRITADTLDGTWAQGPTRLTLRLVRVSGDTHRRRPQDPRRSPLYRDEEVSFAAGDGVVLAGTLSRPAGSAPASAVVLIGGTGPQDRDASVDGHRPFAVLADQLARSGLAVLRFDERGVGRSAGTAGQGTSRDAADDVRAAVEFLARDPRIDPRGIGLIGHSEGGIIAPLVAVETTGAPIAFVVLLGAPGLPLARIAVEQSGAMLRAQGAPAQRVRAQQALVADIVSLYAQDMSDDAFAAALRTLLRRALAQRAADTDDTHIEHSLAYYLSPWAKFAFRHDPAAVLRELHMPVLALTGSLDSHADAVTNLNAIARALAHNPAARTQRMAGLNHFFQTARTGAVVEYALIEETFAPAALALIADWILAARSE